MPEIFSIDEVIYEIRICLKDEWRPRLLVQSGFNKISGNGEVPPRKTPSVSPVCSSLLHS